MDVETEEDLPSYGFVSSQPTDEPENENTNYLSSSNVLAERLKKQEFLKKVEKICVSIQSMKTREESSAEDLLENDTDTQAFLETAVEFKVQPTTLYDLADYKFLDPELCGCLFNHKTLPLKSFMGDYYSTFLSKIRKLDNFEYLVKSTGLQVIPFPKNISERLCRYLFHLMSVHPDFDLVLGCHSYLNYQEYEPTFSDIVSIICNWGASPRDMFPTAPSNFQGIHPGLLSLDPRTPIQIQNYNMDLLLIFLRAFLTIKSPTSYANLLGPMLQFSVNASTYSTSTKVHVRGIVFRLANMEDCHYSLEDLHQKKLSLQNQFFLCTKSLMCTALQLPLAYATLQQFLGVSVIKYTTVVDLQDVFNLVIMKRNNVVRETLADTSYILKLIDLLVGKITKSSTSENTQNYIEKWLGLLRALSLDIQENNRYSDPVLLKEQIAGMVYDLRIHQPELHSLSVGTVDM